MIEYLVNKLKVFLDEENYQEATMIILVLESLMMKYLFTRDYKNLVSITEQLTPLLDENLITDQQSFLQGKISAVTNVFGK